MSERFKLVYNKNELGYMIIDTEDDLRDEIHAWNLLCDLLNEQDYENKFLKYKNDCLQKQLDCRNKNYSEFIKRYYNLLQSNNLMQDEPFPDVSDDIETKLIGVVNNEKRRYICKEIDGYNFIIDLKTNEKYFINKFLVGLLNTQDDRIKELEKIRDKGNQKLENYYNEKINELDNVYNKHFDELTNENQQLNEQLEESKKVIKELSLYSEKLYKLQARIGLEERTVGDVVEELDRLRNKLELLQKENQKLKQSQKQKME